MSAPTCEAVFWMVWREDSPGPRVKHASKGEAMREAKRLARANPGERFVVLQAVDAFECNDLKRIAYEHPIPF